MQTIYPYHFIIFIELGILGNLQFFAWISSEFVIQVMDYLLVICKKTYMS